MKITASMWTTLRSIQAFADGAPKGTCPRLALGVGVRFDTTQGLVRRGLVKLVKCPFDHETREAEITAAGRALLASTSGCVSCRHDRVHSDGAPYCGRRDGRSALDSDIESWATSLPLDLSGRPENTDCPGMEPRR